jgi:phage-related protein
MLRLKPIEFLGNSRKALAAFPDEARRTAGFQLDGVQRGIEPDDWKPFRSIGLGVVELRVRDSAGAFRVIYVAKFEDAIYVLHAFQKKGRKTARLDIELARTRYVELMKRQAP